MTGSRERRGIGVDIGKSTDPANNGTQKAVISRVRISPDVPAIEPSRYDAKYIGATRIPAQALPNNIILGPDGKAYVSDHAGVSRPTDVESGIPQGYPVEMTVLDALNTADPAHHRQTNAIHQII